MREVLTLANERRLIDAEALWQKLESESWYDNADRDEVALPLVDAAPTVDAVEVVRCRECKHYRSGKPFPGTSYCARLPYYAGAGGLNVGDEDYCSYGERRERPQRKETNGV